MPAAARDMRGVILAAVLLFPRCGNIEPSRLPVYLQPLPGATEVIARQHGPEAGVQYELHACYPASEVLQAISSRVPKEWIVRREDFLNPGIPTSQVRGWTNYYDERTKPGTWVHHWAGEWQDPSGGILSYNLMYR